MTDLIAFEDAEVDETSLIPFDQADLADDPLGINANAQLAQQSGVSTQSFIGGLAEGLTGGITGAYNVISDPIGAASSLGNMSLSDVAATGIRGAGTLAGGALVGGGTLGLGAGIGAGLGNFAAGQLNQMIGLEQDTPLSYDIGTGIGETAFDAATLGTGRLLKTTKIPGHTQRFAQGDTLSTNMPALVTGAANKPGLSAQNIAQRGSEAFSVVDESGVFLNNDIKTIPQLQEAIGRLKQGVIGERNTLAASIPATTTWDEILNSPAIQEYRSQLEKVAVLDSDAATELNNFNTELNNIRQRAIQSQIQNPSQYNTALLSQSGLNASDILENKANFNAKLRNAQAFEEPTRLQELETQRYGAITQALQEARDRVDPTGKLRSLDETYGSYSDFEAMLQQGVAGDTASAGRIYTNEAKPLATRTSIGSGGFVSTAVNNALGKAESFLTRNPDTGSIQSAKFLQNRTDQTVQGLRKLSRIRRGEASAMPGRVRMGIGNTFDALGVMSATVQTVVGTDQVLSAIPEVQAEMYNKLTQPMAGESPEQAELRAQAYVQDFTAAMTQGHPRQRRQAIAMAQRDGLLPPNPIQGEVDGYIELPEDRQMFIDNLRTDLELGRITSMQFAIQMNEMANRTGGRIITTQPDAEATLQVQGLPQSMGLPGSE